MWEQIKLLKTAELSVLILVCVEDSVGVRRNPHKYDANGVLILVCVEDSVGE